MASLKHWKKKKIQLRIQYPLKMYFRNGVKIKSFSDKENLRDMDYKKKVRVSSSGRSKMMPDTNLDLYKGMKSAGNDKCVSKYKKLFLLFCKAMLISMYLLEKYTYTEFFKPISPTFFHFSNIVALVHILIAS